jgi:hypothetical protein
MPVALTERITPRVPTGNGGSVDATGNGARFSFPTGLALDSAGNLYVADWNNSTIRRVTPTGSVTTRAGTAGSYGSADGVGPAARFNNPSGVAVDRATNIYVADSMNHTIRKITPGRVVTTIAGQAESAGRADGIGNAARFDYPASIAVDSAGNLYVADANNNAIRKLRLVGTNWVVTTLGGLPGVYGTADGTGGAARFGNPNGVTVDSAGNLYVADFYFNTIRKGYGPPRITIANPPFIVGRFRLGVTGPPAHAMILEASQDLLGWILIQTNIFDGALVVEPQRADSSSRRFFRARMRQ